VPAICGEQALALATSIGNQRAIGDAHNNLGWLDAGQGRLDSADVHLDRALALFRKAGRPEHVAVTLSNKGWVAEKRGDQVGALKHFLDALRSSEQAGDSASTSILLYSIGIAYRKTGDIPQALEFLERSAALERALGRTNKQANCAVAIGNTYREQGDTARALERMAEAAAIFTTLRDHQGLGITAENTGDLLALQRPCRCAERLPHRTRPLRHPAQHHRPFLCAAQLGCPAPTHGAYGRSRRGTAHRRSAGLGHRGQRTDDELRVQPGGVGPCTG
jgi:tetratricopeptide (TPR) repeat protein